MTQKSDKEKIEEELHGLERILLIADENGLFLKKYNPLFSFEEISQIIQSGFKELNKKDARGRAQPNTIGARYQYGLAFDKLYTTMNQTRQKWRFTYSYGGPIFLYFFVISILIFSSWILYAPAISASQILMVPSWAYLWGSIGGVLQGVWRLWHDLETQSLRRHLLAWYFILPFMGAILGAIAYLIFLAGFIVATGAGQITSEFFVMLLSALAGFSSKWMVMLLLRVATLIQPQE